MLAKIHLAVSFVFFTSIRSQQRGTVTPEGHPPLTTYICTKSGGCAAQTSKLVIDADWRWLHGLTSPYPNCKTGSSWNSSLCPDPVTCAKNCALDGASRDTYASEYGITTSGDSLTQLMYPKPNSAGSRAFLLADDNHYQLLQLKNQEISFDVDVSSLPCGTNGALYLISMAADGGQSAYPNNKAGAYMGTGYCDAQCPRYGRFIDGEANFNSAYGNCCNEIDIWEANSVSTDLSLHPCNRLGPYRCNTASSTDCKICDGVGCDFNPYRQGNTTYYGPSAQTSTTVSTNPGKIRVVTQFITDDKTSTGKLQQIRHFYIRGGIKYNAQSRISGMPGDMLTDDFCTKQSNIFSPSNDFAGKGGMQAVENALNAGMVLSFSLWVDGAGHMRTLDGTYPSGSTAPGAVRGPCPASAGDPNDIKSQYPNTKVVFSNIRYGELDSTYGLPWPPA